jgi:hypothetical protein
MRWISNQRAEFQRLAHGISICECVYEDLVADLARVDADGVFPSDAKSLRPLAEFLSVPNQFRYMGNIHKAINRPYEEVIENYDEVLRAVEASEFAEFVAAAKAA